MKVDKMHVSLVINEVVASFLSKMFNHQIAGTDTNKCRLMILPYGITLLQNKLQQIIGS